MVKRLSAFILALSMVFSMGNAVYASEKLTNDGVYVSQYPASSEELDFVCKVAALSEYWEINDDDCLQLNISQDDLRSKYGYSQEVIDRINNSIVGTYVPESSENVPAPAAYVKNGALYITYDDLCGGAFAALATAASAGPAAMAAALTAISTAFSGPVGTIISGILAVAAAPSLTELCGRVIYAIATKQGIYIKPVLAYPPLKMGYF